MRVFGCGVCCVCVVTGLAVLDNKLTLLRGGRTLDDHCSLLTPAGEPCRRFAIEECILHDFREVIRELKGKVVFSDHVGKQSLGDNDTLCYLLVLQVNEKRCNSILSLRRSIESPVLRTCSMAKGIMFSTRGNTEILVAHTAKNMRHSSVALANPCQIGNPPCINFNAYFLFWLCTWLRWSHIDMRSGFICLQVVIT